ncbi:Tti2-like protein [Elsinoe fawcettii]|nr:Tti2-like protein [Elsinoe fawcettii]
MAAHAATNGSRKLRDLELQLTEVEDTLRKLLLDVADFIKDSPIKHTSQVSLPAQLADEKTVLRFTGGWVRDKLLGVDSHDIDVAINNMTGEQFGLQMKEYLEQPGNAEKYGLEGVAKTDSQADKGANGKNKLVGGLHKIEANPEKSKHLETITTRILGLDIDLVNLRKETYTDDSRNPQIEFGTPEEDALRRDATINAMFYNLNTRKIEDLTGRGFDDMEAQIIRTPLEPYQTFKDDPLRVLRLIRFASRLNYQLDPDAARNMTNEDIKAALKIKISRERVGVELEKMLRGPDPFRALTMIREAGLYKTVFSDPTPGAVAYDPENDTWAEVLDNMRTAATDKEGLVNELKLDPEDVYTAWTLACLVPYRNAPQAEAPPGRKQPPPMPTVIAREGFKATNKICDVVTASIKNAEDIRNLAQSFQDRPKRPRLEDVDLRETLGMAIRRWGSTWRLQTIFSLLCDVAEQPEQAEPITTTYNRFLQQIKDFSIEEAYAFRPIMDGKQLAKAIGINPGPWMKDALDVVMAWQLRNPGNTSVEEAVEQVKNSKVHGVTAHGRKDTRDRPAAPMGITFGEEAEKQWKKKEHQALGVLAWTIRNLSDSLVEQHWHLVVPPILALIDDHEVPFKARGCELLSLLLERTPRSLLAKTGLVEVFADALRPCLGFLPTLTPVEEAVELLNHVFPAYFSLYRTAYPQQDGIASAKGVKFLDSIMHRGIFAIYTHCPEHISILSIVLHNLCLLQDELGLETAKHLKSVAPMVKEILCNPFGSASPKALVLALQALQSLIRNAWPLIADCRVDILESLCLCWQNVEEAGDAGQFDDVRREARTTVAMLRVAVGQEAETDIEALVTADQDLQDLFALQ